MLDPNLWSQLVDLPFASSDAVKEFDVCSFFVGWYVLGADVAVLVVAVLEAVAVREPPDAHPALVVPFGPVFEVLAHEVAFPNFVLLHFELVDHALVFVVLLGSFGTVAFLALLSPFVAFLLLACCCCLGNDSSYVGLSWVKCR